MIDRYSRPAMAGIFAASNKLSIWLDVELAVAEAMAELGSVPQDDIRELRRQAEERRAELTDPAPVDAIEAVTRHDVIAFLTHVENLCGPAARFLHLGMTSSDLLDTTLAVQLKQAGETILAETDRLLEIIKRRTEEHRQTVTIGRSHGIHAEPVTFGFKLASFYAEFKRQRDRLAAAFEDVATCAVSGAVGTFANIDPRVEAMVAERLGLRIEPVSTQVIPRDRHAHVACALAQLASSIERLATEIRHLQRTEVREAEEFFHKGQKGSSAMPHKRNPVLTENLTGLARMIRASVIPALENVALWHERDISHSSVERVMLADSCILTDFALARLSGMMDKLVVYPERMQANLDSLFGLHNSQRVLLALVDAGLPRQEAYVLVQRNAMRAWEEGRELHGLLAADNEVIIQLGAEKLATLFDDGYHTKHIDMIVDRALSS